MARANLWSRNVPRVELDHRARDARIQLLRIEPLFVQRAASTRSWLTPLTGLFGFRVRMNLRRSVSLGNPKVGRMLSAEPSATLPMLAVRTARWSVVLFAFSIAMVLVGGTAAAWFGSPPWNLWPPRRRLNVA
jgi:hypothetical protein